MRLLIFIACLMLCPSYVMAQTRAVSTKTETGWSYVLCNAETTNGICDGADGDMYVNVGSFHDFNVFFSQSGSGATCDIYAADIATAMAADMSSFSQNKINSVSLSSTQDSIGFAGSFEYIWIKCATIGTSVTVTLRGSVGLTRQKR